VTASSDGHAKRCAIDALGHSKSPEALAPLLELLGNQRRIDVVANALGELGDPDAIAPLEAHWEGADVNALLSDEDENIPALWDLAAVGGALLRLGRGGVEPTLARLAIAEDVAIALEAIAGLRWSGETIAVNTIRRAMTDERDELADAAVEALGALGLPAVAPSLLEAATSHPLRGAAVWHAFRAMFGDDIPAADEEETLRQWWEESSARWPRDRHVWWGGEDLGHAISKLPGRDGGIARTHLELWTGVDMVDAAARRAAGDYYDMVRASLWWQRVPWDWDRDAVYRARRRLDPAPILTALEGSWI
jgi:HEAT repeat protein